MVVCRGRLGSFRNLSFPAWGGGGPDTPPWNPDNPAPNPSPASTRPSMDGSPTDGWMDKLTGGIDRRRIGTVRRAVALVSLLRCDSVTVRDKIQPLHHLSSAQSSDTQRVLFNFYWRVLLLYLYRNENLV